MSSAYSFDLISSQLELIEKNRDVREQLLQYNLDQTLQILKFRITGHFNQSQSDYEEVLNAFISSPVCTSLIGRSGEASMPLEISKESLTMNITTMDYFDRLSETGIVGPGGKIRGCFDEVYEGITVGDLLREFLLNPDSENSCTYTESEQKEVIFQLFRLLVIGGTLCQPETDIAKYLSITKALYKEIVTVFRANESNAIQVSGKAFKLLTISGLEFFPENPTSPHHVLLVIIDPMKKQMTIVKNTFKNFW